ncbi:MAG TPA: hypothetical protein VMU65_02235 [Candidatus Saccharimonadales bacterium]|nr:hypothetical protein [Candidatus Saccharimonadales bacterium]
MTTSPSYVAAEVACILVGFGIKHNALRTADWSALPAVADELASRSGLNVVVIRGVDGSFSSGPDLSEWQTADTRYVDRTFAAMEAALEAFDPAGRSRGRPAAWRADCGQAVHESRCGAVSE